MKRYPVAVITTSADGTETQHAIYPTMKEAEKTAREMAMNRLRETGIQTRYHSTKVYRFEDDFLIQCTKVIEQRTIQYVADFGAMKQGEIRRVELATAEWLISEGHAIEVTA